MNNWQTMVRKKLEGGGLPRAHRDDVIHELAAHLEESYAQARSGGLADDAAVEQTLQQVEDWDVLAEDIRRAKPREDDMNHRTKTLWLPGIAIMFGAGLLLVFLDRAASLQRFIWIGCMAMLLVAAASESNRLNHRTRSFWLPGFVSMTAATLFLFAADIVSDPFLFFSQISLHPQDLLRTNSGPRWFYFVWLLAQVLFGALGALFSRRAGGTRTSRIVAGALPAIIIVGTYVVLIPFTSKFSGNAAISPLPTFVASAMFVWVGAPAVVLLLGAAPFLKELQPRIAWN
jgi:hypothetical protein